MDEELRDLLAEAECLLHDVLQRGTGDALTSLLVMECAHTLRDLKDELARGEASPDAIEDAMLVLSALEETIGRTPHLPVPAAQPAASLAN